MEELRTDLDLLREYAERGVESAFGALVQRHLNLVFATARRRLGDDAAAREVTQNVFVSLARKALRLLSVTSLAGWPHQAMNPLGAPRRPSPSWTVIPRTAAAVIAKS